MKYAFTVSQVEVEGKLIWIAKSKDLDYCVGQGDSCDEAIRELEENEQIWLEMAREDGEDIPKPSVEREVSYSGKFTVRLSKGLHKKLAVRAQNEGISLNAFVVEAIAEKVGEIPKKTLQEILRGVKKLGIAVQSTGILIDDLERIKLGRKGEDHWTTVYGPEIIKTGERNGNGFIN